MAGLIGYKLGINDGSDTSSLTPLEVRDEEWNETNDLGERKVVPHETMHEFKELLDSLLCSSGTEKSEPADSNGVTTPAMKKVIKRFRVEEMLQTLEMLSKHEKAIVEMEKHGILKSLSEILGEDVGERAKGYCVDIIHAICHASSAINTKWQIKEAENARQTLERLVRVGTKAKEVLLKLQEWANEESS